jgi:hypothetical protein
MARELLHLLAAWQIKDLGEVVLAAGNDTFTVLG